VQRIGAFIVPPVGGTIVITGLPFTPQRLLFRAYVLGELCVGYADIILQACSRAYVLGGNGAGSYDVGSCLRATALRLRLASLDPNGFTLDVLGNPAEPTPAYFLAERD